MRKSKVILGLKKAYEFTELERKKIVEEYLSSGQTKQFIWEKYTGEPEERGRLLRWMRQLGYDIPKKWSKLAASKGVSEFMEKKGEKSLPDLVLLQEQIQALEKALIASELRANALDTLIEVAEKELKINIRKKSYTKQSKK